MARFRSRPARRQNWWWRSIRRFARATRRAPLAATPCCKQYVAWDTQFPFPVLAKVATGLRGVKLGVQPVPLSADRQRGLDAFRESVHRLASVPEELGLKKLG